MKQYTRYDKDFREVEYHEIDENGKIIYSQFTTYFKHDENSPTTIICQVKDTNGWVRLYNKDGVLTEWGKPFIKDNFRISSGTISGVFTNCVGNV